MSTTTETTAARPARKPRKKKQFIVTLGGIPCRRRTYRGIFGSKLIPAGGALVKNLQYPEIFPGERSAGKAVQRAFRLRKTLQGSVCDFSKQHPELIENGEFKVVPYTPPAE